MQRERVSENVYWFQSDIYAQVTAGVIAGPTWAVLIDTLALPEETLAMRDFIEDELKIPVHYIINTHHHADHCWGNCFFPGATVIGHILCRKLIQERGNASLEEAKHQNPIFKQVKIVPPHITFDEGMISLRVGKKTLILASAPGHSPDGISVLVEEDRVLFAGDAFLPLPSFIDGDIDEMTSYIRQVGKMGLENIIQGHGDIILRGEIDAAVKENLSYLSNIRKVVRTATRRRNPQDVLAEASVDSCGKSRVYLGGLAEELHRRNLKYLYRRALEEIQAGVKDQGGEAEDNDEGLDNEENESIITF
jgi:glyoxylase-like metal-dependent hydrolase (beta-lactamase superfamily II)